MSSFSEVGENVEQQTAEAVAWASHDFVKPSRGIMEASDMDNWKKSPVREEIFSFIKQCTESVVGRRCSDVQALEDGTIASTAVMKFVEFMRRMRTKLDDFPPLQQPMRFGNKAFRQWHECLISESDVFLADLLPVHLHSAVKELAPYIHTAFGNEVRIDYGTGHETAIMIFFLCLYKLRVITAADLSQVVLRGFHEYVKTMRCLQTVYLLEPAGSHGVWGLDDYHCLIFLFGAAQLCVPKDVENNNAATAATAATAACTPSDGAELITPLSIHDKEVLEEYSPEYMYLEGIQFIKVLKTGAPFAETSPMLNDISHLGEWSRICAGLLRLYEAEVLSKFPVVQHLLFGTILVSPTLGTGSVDSRSLAGVS